MVDGVNTGELGITIATAKPPVKALPKPVDSIRGLQTSVPDLEDDQLFVGIGEAKPSVKHERTELKLDTIRDIPRPQLLRELIERHEKEQWVPTIDEAKTLMCTLVRDHWRALGERTGNTEAVEKHLRADYLPWPESAEQTVTEIPPKTGATDEWIITRASRRFGTLGTVVDLPQNGQDALFHMLPAVVAEMPEADKAQLGIWVLDNLDNFSPYGWRDEMNQLLIVATDGLDHSSPEALDFGHKMVKFLGERFKTEDPEALDELAWGGEAYWSLSQFTHHDRQIPLYRALSSGVYDEATQRRILGLTTRVTSLPQELNMLRKTLDIVAPDEREQVSQTLRSVLGLLSDQPVYTRLGDLYAAIKFEEYPLSLAVEADRTQEVTALLERNGVLKEDKVLDLGCGTGWLVNGLVQNGFTNAHGLDVSERNIEVAREKYGDRFDVGNWYKLPIRLNFQDAIIAKERTLPHTEEKDKFFDVLAQVQRTVAEDGLFIFDMPDPGQASYWENVQRYREVMRQFGYPEQELNEMWYVVDSPDGQNFYNRYVPPKEELVDMLASMGFKVEEFITEDIPNGKGDKNMLFVCRKVSDKERFELMKQLEAERVATPPTSPTSA